MAEILSMGDYGFYVWTSYIVIAILFVLNYFLPISRQKKITRSLARFYKTSSR
jgi:heme exporter protein CcmD